ncbi:exodeoxyribonuclease V subunit gamma [Luteimonas pelagia]
MPAASDFRLHHSNALEVLAGLLAAELRTPAPGQPLLAPDVVLIPQAAMRRWLQAHLAEAHGIAANLEFLAPGEFVTRALDANLGKVEDDLDAGSLHWRLYGALTDPDVLAKPPLAQVAAYLGGGDPLKPWSLAGELAEVFGKYQAWRRDWLLRWEAGADPGDPQAILWREVAGGRAHRARRIQAYLDRFEGEGKPLPQGLPSRLFAFATVNVSPDVLRVIATQSRVGTLHFHLPAPSRKYWGDLPTYAERLRAGEDHEDNALLQAWGAAGRDFMAVLGGYEVVHPDSEHAHYADPEAHDGDDPARDDLLGRLQRNLLHRRPDTPFRQALDRTDNSLQLHACHTPLRELQVLHDQLRGLLEDDRFDPPLQPRDIAVLAPDIDVYAPYLDAVFGGVDPAERIPYALADTSPLASEPLAEVFLRLLALPISRFGLNEILDLLASAPVAEATGLDAPAFERLHGWLREAGARWGLDAAHRGSLDAPADDAGTWQFALDRLLLGHASGADGTIEGVAPWPGLEGGALDALDTLLRLLRVLARQRVLLGEAMPPAQWRERLLALLEALLPAEPADPASRRALDRLRSHVDDFAKHAATAGFGSPVPGDVVRAHFAAVLGEADTRAPLLTGGVSFGRMVPMRLLPFRVICVLGMNDGDYPRRDPAAGLSRLTAELGTDRRRPGDRSLRDDDRYLFLQLLTAARDVFYVSYLGADPRDNSVREPSALVGELVDSIAALHADGSSVRRDLVVRHSLQPFSAAAFGAHGDPRRFSYRARWRAAAAQAGGMRTPLPPWSGAALPPMPVVAPDLSLDALRRFLVDPSGQFLRHRLDLRLAEIEEVEDDTEPLQAPRRGLLRNRLQRAVFDAVLRGDDDAATHADLRARGLLPSGPLGTRTLAELREEVAPYAEAFGAWRGDTLADAPRLTVDIDGTRVHGRIADAYPQGIARLRFGEPNGPSVIRNGLDWLFASAAGLALPLVSFEAVKDVGVGPHARAPLDRATAHAVLRHLLDLRARGLREPLPFAPYSGWSLHSAATLERGLRAAAARWHGGPNQWAEGQGDAVRIALRGRDPFVDEATRLAFVDLSMSIFGALTCGQVHGGTDAAALKAIVLDFDAEDAA